MRDQGIGSWTARRARKTPDKTAVIHGEARLSYRELHERAVRLAHGLRGLGLRRGDRVAYLGPNHPSFLETLFAAGMNGMVFVPLNMRLTGAELSYCLADSGASVLVSAPGHAAELTGRRVSLDGEYEPLLAAASTEPVDEPVTLDDPCMIMYTSGTTGRPKGAVLSHGNITWNALNFLVDVDLAADEVTLVVAPLFHTAGLNVTCLPTLLKGGAVVLASAFDPSAVLELIGRHRVTFMFGVPTMYDAIAACPGWADADLSSLRQLACGGAPVPPATIRAYQRRGLSFSQGYGMTEASPGALYLVREASEAKAGTAGVPHFFTDVAVVDPDGRAVKPGEKGEVVVSGPNVMLGYWGRPDDTAAAMAGGVFHSGDIATVDEGGYVSIAGRLKDMIISGGENVYPAEVEAALREHPDVADCAVIGVPDERWGEVGRAVVVARPGATPDGADLLGSLRGALAGYKIPKSVVFVDELPRSGAGKVLKNRLRERYG
ncbi:acyl-CoA synthetase [Pseudonocardia acaciae]|uniref:acyl-CoA synthetase n=1 Tax=Pseudonocardia acaciae TaxID=551276 RepID=UPI00048C1933|nr:long-chain fatty acid--CoA ligase [Pseudonocardia acaciae]